MQCYTYPTLGDRLIPSMIVTNDWFTGLVAAYAKSGAFGLPSVFSNTFFFHLIHNLDPSYEGMYVFMYVCVYVFF
jgi:glycogen synthase